LAFILILSNIIDTSVFADYAKEYMLINKK